MFDPNNQEDSLLLQKAGKMSKCVNLIINGTVTLMNKHGVYDYCSLNDGSYFGEISLLLNEPNKYSYFWNQFQEQPL